TLTRTTGASGETPINPVTGLPYEANDPRLKAILAQQGEGGTKTTISLEGQQIFQQYWDAKEDYETFGKLLKSGIGGTARSFVDTESDKTAEARRQFLDFMDRAKALYGLEEAERGYIMDGAQAAADERDAAQKGLLMNWGARPSYTDELNNGRPLS